MPFAPDTYPGTFTPDPPAPKETTPTEEVALSDRVIQNIEAIAEYQLVSERSVSRYQLAIESTTEFLGRPLFLYAALAFVALWIILNLSAPYLHWKVWDPPPFYWLQGIVGLAALLMTIVVLITQNRQGRISARHSQLDLQISMLAEQKTAKIIALLEELRRDMPNVKDRADPEAEAMTEAADPHAVLSALEETLEHAQEEVEVLEEAVDAVIAESK